MKKLGLGIMTICLAVLLSGCGQQSSPTNHRNPATESSSLTQASQSSVTTGQENASEQTGEHQNSSLWNGAKDRQLEEFINSWAL